MDNINIKKLAKELNLSAATVSRALRDSYEISIETKQRVRDLAQKLNYEPNPSASNLRSQKSKTIAVIIPAIANNFFSQAINGIEEVARKRGYHVLIYQTHEDHETEISFINKLLNGRVDGILISVCNHSRVKDYYKKLSITIPFVFFDRSIEGLQTVNIITDDFESSFGATIHLIECGCKKIAYLYALDNLTTGKRRIAGYYEALKKHDMFCKDELIIKCEKDVEQNYKSIKLLLMGQKPDGIIASIEELALPCYHICKELHLSIPNDIKLISFSNLDTASVLNPSLTTITQPAYEMGKNASTILFKILDKKYFESEENLVLKSVLVKRESTGL
ncbi:LacI family transcriptional regulator [bacterium]|nr:MAG: LacI family transcriptional regulator [bacterium]